MVELVNWERVEKVAKESGLDVWGAKEREELAERLVDNMPELDWDHLAEVLDKATDNMDIETTPETLTDPGDSEVLGGPNPSHSYLDGVASMTTSEDIRSYWDQDRRMFKAMVKEIMLAEVKGEYPDAEESSGDVTLEDGNTVFFFFTVERVNERASRS